MLVPVHLGQLIGTGARVWCESISTRSTTACGFALSEFSSRICANWVCAPSPNAPSPTSQHGSARSSRGRGALSALRLEPTLTCPGGW
eukprot:3250692-Rhodomonas_salina.2